MRHIIAASLLLTGCVAQHRPPPAPPIVVEPPHVQAPAPIGPPVDDAEFIPADSPEVQEAMDRYVRTGKAPLISKKASGFVTFPFGLSQPVVSCKPLELCDIELAPGEEVLDFAAGDQTRWVFQPLRQGTAEHRVIHIMAKPTDTTSDMQTTIVIGTTERTYRIKLISRLRGAVVNARFYYPEDLLKQFNQGHENRPIPAKPVDMAAVLATRNEYKIEGDPTLYPSMIGHDNAHTFFLMPTSLHTIDAPVLYEIAPSGKRTQVNYRLVGSSYYMADKLFEKAALVWGVDEDERIVTITRTQG
jgi:P-type conjugative transfer protein TrbG